MVRRSARCASEKLMNVLYRKGRSWLKKTGRVFRSIETVFCWRRNYSYQSSCTFVVPANGCGHHGDKHKCLPLIDAYACRLTRWLWKWGRSVVGRYPRRIPCTTRPVLDVSNTLLGLIGGCFNLRSGGGEFRHCCYFFLLLVSAGG